MSEKEKFEQFGRMVFGMIEDTLMSKQVGGCSYAMRDITLPDGHGGKHNCVVVIASGRDVTDLMEKGVSGMMPVVAMPDGGRA